MATEGTTQHTHIDWVVRRVTRPHLRQVIKQGFYWFCIASVALICLACTIENDDETNTETAATNLTFEVLFATGISQAQVAALFMEVWIHDLDDSAFDNGNRDSDQVDTASQLVQRVAVSQVPNGDIQDDRLTFDVDLADGVSAGNNLVFSVLLFAAMDSVEPDFVARQGAFVLPTILGQIVSLTLGAVELVQFGDATVNEGLENVVFTGTLMPNSPRAVVLNFQTQDGTSPEVDAAVAGEDYEDTNDVVRFEPGVTEEMFVVSLINDVLAENTESFDVQLALDLQFATNNRAFLVSGLNGGTFAQITATIMDEDSAMLPPPPPTGIRLEVLLPDGLDVAQAGDLLLEVWTNDLDDSPFDLTDRDSDQVDTATRLLNRVAVRDIQVSDEITDRLLLDIDLANGVSAGNNLVFSVLTFPTNESELPTLIARQGDFDLPDAFGRTISMAFGTAEVVQFDGTTVEESAPNAIFLGSINPASPRVVVLNFEAQDGTSPEFDAAREDEDYAATNGVVRFEAGEMEETIIVPIINDAFAEPTEVFDVLLELDIRSAANNRAFLAGGLNGGTFAEITGTITDEDAPTVAPPPANGFRLAVALPPELSAEQAGTQQIEIWLHDIDDNPFAGGSRDRDQIDIAIRLQERVAVQNIVLDGNVADPLTFDINFENEVTIGNNLVVSVLLFPTDVSAMPTFIGRQGLLDLEDLLGQSSSVSLGTAAIVEFNDTTVSENVGNAAFAGTLAPATGTAIEVNFRTQNGTTPQVAAARAGQDYGAAISFVRFDPGETAETIIVSIIDDDKPEPTESFDVQLELDIRFPVNNRTFLANGINGGTFGLLTGTITDND